MYTDGYTEEIKVLMKLPGVRDDNPNCQNSYISFTSFEALLTF